MNTTRRNSGRDAYNMMTVGYRDYLAARFLINNDFLIQGLAMSSLAVEKYLKTLLFANGESREVHLNKWKEIKSAYSKHRISLFEELDETYLDLLGKAYSLRYYDKVNTKSQYGFIKWQVLAELDFMVNLIESRTAYNDENGNEIRSLYKIDKEAKSPGLYQENYVLQGQNKKKFMEREGKSVAIFFDGNGAEIVMEGTMSCAEYKGRILVTKSIEIR